MRPLDPITLQKLKKKLQTQSENADPRMEVALTRARMAVVDSNYWTVETIRTKEGLGDISLAARRLKNYGRPDRIYEIHVDNGTVNTTIREYPDMLRNGWKHQFTLGPGSAVAIAFDGEWELWRKKWRLKTTEKPWIMWVDDLGDLYTQLWDEVDTRLQLASAVLKVKAIRGWKNLNISANDQGIVVGYIKTDKKLYYRNYCVQSDGLSIWESERAISAFTSNIENLNMFLTNDYRMGFIVEDSLNKVHWIITDKNWAGMAIIPEYISVKATAKVNFTPVTYIKAYENENITINATGEVAFLFGATWNNVISLTNIDDGFGDWGRYIDFKVENAGFSVPTITLFDIDGSIGIPVGSTTQLDSNTYRVEIAAELEPGINNLMGDIRIDINNLQNEAGYVFDSITTEFTPINLVPISIPLPEVEVIWNE